MTETLSIPGNTFTIIEDGEATAGRIGVVECELEPGWLGPPQHTHKQHDETFYVLEGAVRFATGERSFVLRRASRRRSRSARPTPSGTQAMTTVRDCSAPSPPLATSSTSASCRHFRRAPEGRLDPATVRDLMDDYDTEPYPATS